MATPKKVIIPEMYPTKKHLTELEACAYVSMSSDTLAAVIRKSKVNVYSPSATRYYRVDQLDRMIEESIIVNNQI